MDVRQDGIVAAEALLRWQPPGPEMILPKQFIGIAEETGVIEGIGLWLMEQASRASQDWFSQGGSLDHLAVNVASRQLQNKQFVEQVESVIRRAGIDPAEL